MYRDTQGRRHRLPRYFYEVPSHEGARETRLTQHFGLNEFALVDLKEAQRLQQYPRYSPCAVRALAFYLQRFRDLVGGPLHISVNGGYRSPGHRMADLGTPHMWGTAADIFRIGGTILNTHESIDKYNKIAEELSDDLYVMPYGHEPGTVDDHLHIDLGYITMVPREINEDRMEHPQQKPRFAFEDRRRQDRRVTPSEMLPPVAEGEKGRGGDGERRGGGTG